MPIEAYVSLRSFFHERRARSNPTARIAVAVAWVCALLGGGSAQGLPSFAQQTGKPCAQCHTVAYGPALSSYGRQFKLNGYVWGEVAHSVPLALMVQGGFTHLGKDLVDPAAPHFARNENLSVDQVSGFYGGRISAHSGGFVQVTYSGEARHTHWDNTDVRYARAITLGNHSAVWGISVNNNPTVQDLWNSTPAWGFPDIASALAPTPAGKPVIAGGLAQTVLGATLYAMFDDHLYLEGGAYRGVSDRWLSRGGIGADASPHLEGLSPYGRASWQIDWGAQYLSAGLFALDTRRHPDPLQPATDRLTDVGFDATYQYLSEGGDALAANFALIHEKQSRDASFAAGASAPSDSLRTLSVDLTYAYRQTWVTSVQLFDTRGSTDMTLYGPAPVSGSLSGSPDSRGSILLLEYIPFGKLDSPARPWLNVRVGVQYTAYQRFNGAGANYDGFGRAASENNTLFAFFWFVL